MHSSKLFKVLAVLSKEEWLEMRYFIKHRRSTSPQVKALFAYIFQRRTNLESKIFTLDHVTSKAFEGMSKKNLQNMMSKLTLIVENFLIYQHMMADKDEVELRRFEVYNERRLFDLANLKAKSLKDEWNNSKNLDLKKVNNLVRLQHAHYFSENPIKYVEGNLVLENLFKSFNDFKFIYEEYYGYAIDKAILVNSTDETKFKTIGQSQEYLISEISKIVVNINQLFKTSDKQAFEYLYQTLKLNDRLSSELKSLIFSACEFYLIILTEKGQSGHNSKTILYLYQFGISSGILLFNNSLSTLKFSNILTIACLFEEFEWAEEYVKKYIALVPTDDREESFVFSKIKIHFGKWEYQEALNLLNTSILNNFSLKLQSRWYSLVIYFITFDNFDFLESQMSSFIQFFYYNKKRISFRNFDGSLNLAKILRSAVSFNKDFNLETEIAKYENIIFRNRLESIFEQRRIYKKANNIDL